MGSPKETKRKTPDTEFDKTIDEESGGSNANEESGNVVEQKGVQPPTSPASRLASFEAWRDSVDSWMAKSDAWREKTDDKLKALTHVLLETRDLVRSLTPRSDTYQPSPAELDERARASKSLYTGDPDEIKAVDDYDEEGDEADSKFSKSRKEVKELKKLLDSVANEEEEDGEDRPSPVLTPTSTLGKGKRKNGDDTIPAPGSALKKINSERRGSDITPSSAQGRFKEEEIRAVLLQRYPITTSQLVATFKARLKSPENKKAFTTILKRISKIQKSSNNQKYVVLRK